MKIVALVCCLAAFGVQAAVGWKNVDESHYLNGRKASAGYLQGKVVLVNRWGAKNASSHAILPRIEELWQNFKTKNFVVLGSHCGGWGGAAAVKQIADENNLSYPVYEDAALKENEPKSTALPFLYVVDETGWVRYRGHDERAATEAVVSALTDLESPKNTAQFMRYLDFELENLPGRAYLRLADFKKKYPNEAKQYAEKERTLNGVADVKRLAELVALSRKYKDTPALNAKRDSTKRTKYRNEMNDALRRYASLKESNDPRVVQEAKNALADLTWALLSVQ